jgi:two-component system phosphate regulon sensor histidine kinase PhoR
MDNHALRPEIIEAKKGRAGTSIRFSSTLQQNMMYVAIGLKIQQEIAAVIRTSLPVTAIDVKLKSIQIRIALGGLLIALLAAGISLYVSRRISRPIEKMKQAAEYFARGDLSHRLPDSDLMELGSLSAAMNAMAAQLEDHIKTVINQRNEIEAVLSSMVEGVIAVDMDERIISLNPAAARIFGINPAQLRGQSVQEMIRNSRMQQFVGKALGSEANLEEDITLYQDRERIVYTHSAPLQDASGKRNGILIVINDVTHLRQLENVRRDFAASVSHEIKTPLTAIKGFVETLRYNTVSDPEESKRFLEIIAKHGDRLTAIIEDLMKLSRIEQQDENKEIKLEQSPIQKLIQRAIQSCREKADAKNIKIDLDCQEDLAAKIDPTLIEQAVFNLLDNAINYSHEQGVVKVSAFKKDREITISIQDHGIGIAKEHIPRLFERFYRADKARSRSLGGTGLGLAIVKHIALAHGGRVSADSFPDKGSTFSLHLPTF